MRLNPRKILSNRRNIGQIKENILSCLISLCFLFLKFAHGLLRKTLLSLFLESNDNTREVHVLLGEREKLWVFTALGGSHKRS